MKQKTCAEILAEIGEKIDKSPVLKAACIYSDSIQKPATIYGYGKVGLIEAFKSGAEWQAKQSPWISVNECPPMDIPLLLKYGDGGIYDLEIGEYSGIHYYNKEGQILDERIVGWMPIVEV